MRSHSRHSQIRSHWWVARCRAHSWHVWFEPPRRAPLGIGDRNRFEIADAILLRDVGRVFAVLRIEYLGAGEIRSRLRGRGAHPEKLVKIDPRDHTPADRVETTGPNDSMQRLEKNAGPTYDRPRPLEHSFLEMGERFGLVGLRCCVFAGLRLTVPRRLTPLALHWRTSSA